MRRWKAGALGLVALLGLYGCIGCKTTNKTQTQTAQPAQTVQVEGGNNPLTAFLVEQADEKDMLLGEMAVLLDTYQPSANETDYSALAMMALTPFSETDGLLADVLILSFYTQKQADEDYAYNAGGQEASLTKQGQLYVYDGTIQDESDDQAYQRQSASFTADGNRMRVEIFQKQKDTSEICTLLMQWMRENDSIIVQCYYTLNGGESYDILRYKIKENTLTFALYESVESKADLFDIPSEALFAEGFITHGTYDNGTVTIQNEGHTLIVGP